MEWIIHQSSNSLMIHDRCVHQKRGMHPAIVPHTLRTTGNVHGFASSPRYAPTLRSTFWAKVSLSQRSFRANMASGGSRETPCHSSSRRAQPPIQILRSQFTYLSVGQWPLMLTAGGLRSVAGERLQRPWWA